MDNDLHARLSRLKLKDIKDLIKQYNLHYKIKLAQKKPDLVNAIISHMDEVEGQLESRKYKFDMPSAVEKEVKQVSTLTKAEKLQYITDNRTKLLKIDNDIFKKFKIDNDKLSLAVRKIKEELYNIEETKLMKQGVNITDKVTNNIMDKVSNNMDVKALSKIQNKAIDEFQSFMVKSNEAVNILNSKKPLTVKQIDFIYKQFDLI